MATYKWCGAQKKWVEPHLAVSVSGAKRSDLPCPQVMSDIKEFQSPIDRTWVTSRSGVREHEKKHGVKQVGSDLKPEDYRV